MGLMDRVKKTGMSIMYDYLDKDPDRNLPKIMDWVDQFAGKMSLLLPGSRPGR